MAMTLPNLYWIEELLPPEIMSKKMFGGVAYYLDEKLVLILIETDESHMHKGLEYPFGIWYGCLFPVEKIKQSTVFLKFPFLENHPASTKWLYLPIESEDFEDHVKLMIREIKKRNPLLGTFTAAATKKPKTNSEVVSTSRPSLFSETEPSRVTKAKDEKPKEAKKAAALSVKANKKPGNAFLLNLLKGKK